MDEPQIASPDRPAVAVAASAAGGRRAGAGDWGRSAARRAGQAGVSEGEEDDGGVFTMRWLCL